MVKLNKLSKEIYQRFDFFSDECFDLEDKELEIELPKIRLEISSKYIDLIWQAYEKILVIVSDQYKIPREKLDRLTSEEIINILNGKEVYIEKNRPIALITIGNKFTMLFKNDVLELKKNLESKLSSNLPEKISGRVACRGKVKGRVLKIGLEDYKDYKKLEGKKDFILVSPMTRPEITLYMTKAKGIITDEGGVTCHAAIVSREYDIPCIVGTKTATSLLEDGDMVELDAINGIVHLLKD